MPEYDAMIRRDEGGPDPLVPEPSSLERGKGKKPKHKGARKPAKPAKAAKKGK